MVAGPDKQAQVDYVILPGPDEPDKKQRSNAATGASAASIRAIASQFVSFYFRAPIKAFLRTRINYMGFARSINPRVQANESWTWRTSSPGVLIHAVKQYGWQFLPNQVLPPMLANVTIGAVLYTSYLQTLGLFYDPSAHASKRVYPPPSIGVTLAAGLTAGTIQSLVAAPLDALQIRFRTSDILEGHYKSMWQYAGHKLREIGARGVFAGWGLSLVKDSIGNALFFATFETIKSQAYYNFVTRYYGNIKPYILNNEPYIHGAGYKPPRPSITPHYALEPAFLLGAGVTASIAQQIVQHPVTTIQEVHYGRLESLDFAAKAEPPRERMLRLYYRAYQTTYGQCKKQAMQLGGWRKWLYKDFLATTIRQVPSTSAGLIAFELVRRKYASGDDVVHIQKDGYDILLA